MKPRRIFSLRISHRLGSIILRVRVGSRWAWLRIAHRLGSITLDDRSMPPQASLRIAQITLSGGSFHGYSELRIAHRLGSITLTLSNGLESGLLRIALRFCHNAAKGRCEPWQAPSRESRLVGSSLPKAVGFAQQGE